MKDTKAQTLAQIMVRNGVTPTRRRQKENPPEEKKQEPLPTAGDILGGPPTLDEIVLDEPKHDVRLTTLELRTLRHARKVRATSIHMSVSMQEKEAIMRYCKMHGFRSASSWLRNLAFRAMGKQIPTRSPRSIDRDTPVDEAIAKKSSRKPR